MSAPFDIVRQPSTAKGTEGELLVEGIHMCYTLERPWLDDAQDISSIPLGVYEVRPCWSEHFNALMPHLMDVPGRSQIMLHPANWVSQLKGCIALGDSRQDTTNLYKIAVATDAFNRFKGWFSSVGAAATVTISQSVTVSK